MHELSPFRGLLLAYAFILVLVLLCAPIAYFFGPFTIVTVYIPLLIIGMFAFLFVGVMRYSTVDDDPASVTEFKKRESEYNGMV